MINKDWAQDYKNRIEKEFKTRANVSTTNGISVYINYKGHKVRFSDHQTSAFSGRHLDEIHVGLKSTKFFVDSKIEKRNPENWEIKTETTQVTNTNYGIRLLFPNAVSIKIIKEKGLSKKKKQPLFLFEVSFEKQIYLK